MKKKEITFAQKAARIKSKYKNANFDPIQMQDMTNELRALRQQQEEYKMQNSVDSKAPMVNGDGQQVSAQQMFWDGGGRGNPTYDPTRIENPLESFSSDRIKPISATINSNFDPYTGRAYSDYVRMASNLPSQDAYNGPVFNKYNSLQNDKKTTTAPVINSGDTGASLGANNNPNLIGLKPVEGNIDWNSTNIGKGLLSDEELFNPKVQINQAGNYIDPLINANNLPEVTEYLPGTDPFKGKVQMKLTPKADSFVNMGGGSTPSNTQAAKTQYLQHSNLAEVPAMLTAAFGILGNLPGMLGKYDLEKAQKQNVTPELIDLEREREMARRQAQASKNITGTNLRNLPAGNYLSNMGAASAGIDASLGDIVGRSYQNEAVANADIMNRAKMFNAQMNGQNDALNYQIAADNMANRANAVQGMLKSGERATQSWYTGANDARMLNSYISDDGYLTVQDRDGNYKRIFVGSGSTPTTIENNPGAVTKKVDELSSRFGKKKKNIN
jgi:hypothetical protein